jgi:hypothetical protein
MLPLSMVALIILKKPGESLRQTNNFKPWWPGIDHFSNADIDVEYQILLTHHGLHISYMGGLHASTTNRQAAHIHIQRKPGWVTQMSFRKRP